MTYAMLLAKLQLMPQYQLALPVIVGTRDTTHDTYFPLVATSLQPAEGEMTEDFGIPDDHPVILTSPLV